MQLRGGIPASRMHRLRRQQRTPGQINPRLGRLFHRASVGLRPGSHQVGKRNGIIRVSSRKLVSAPQAPRRFHVPPQHRRRQGHILAREPHRDIWHRLFSDLVHDGGTNLLPRPRWAVIGRLRRPARRGGSPGKWRLWREVQPVFLGGRRAHGKKRRHSGRRNIQHRHYRRHGRRCHGVGSACVAVSAISTRGGIRCINSRWSRLGSRLPRRGRRRRRTASPSARCIALSRGGRRGRARICQGHVRQKGCRSHRQQMR